MTAAMKARFFAKARVAPADQCWHWFGHPDKDGYGKFTTKGSSIGAHRVAYTLRHGDIPAGLTIDHLCRVPACVNPAHLEAVTRWENTRRGYGATGTCARKTDCPRGHPLIPPNLAHAKALRGHRSCLACQRAWGYVRNQAKKGIAVDFKAYSDSCFKKIMEASA